MSNKRKDELLGEPHGTAAHRLRKTLLFKYVQLAGHDVCFRCQMKIDSVNDLSIEHTTAWQTAADPRVAFFDIEKIAFSHLRCNSKFADRHKIEFASEEAKVEYVRSNRRKRMQKWYTPEKRRAKYDRTGY